MSYKLKNKIRLQIFKFTLLLSVTLIFDWLVISRTGALIISCLELWIASASILIICQLISLKVKTFKDRKKEKNTLMQYDSYLHLILCMCMYTSVHMYTKTHRSYTDKNKYNSLVIPPKGVMKPSPSLSQKY